MADEGANEGQRFSPAHAKHVAITAIVVVAVMTVAGVAFVQGSRDVNVFVQIISGFGPVYAIIGTLAGAYFGIKFSSDTIDKTKDSLDKANSK